MTVGIERSTLSKPGSIIVSSILLATLFTQGGCALFSRKGDGEPEKSNFSEQASTPEAASAEVTKPTVKPEPEKIELTEKQKIFTSIDMRLQVLEAKLSSLNDKIDSTKNSLETLTANMAPNSVGTLPHPGEGAGLPVGQATSIPPATNDPEAGFINDDSILAFRRAMILYQGQKYPEAVLSFSEFIEAYPDYPLAGTAQYYIAESYFHQREYKLARQEFQRVLNNYDQSPHVSDSLRGLAFSSEILRDNENAAKYRQLLTSIFPQSPAAGTPRPNLPTTEKRGGAETARSRVDDPPIPLSTLGMEAAPEAKASEPKPALETSPQRFPATAPIGLADHP